LNCGRSRSAWNSTPRRAATVDLGEIAWAIQAYREATMHGVLSVFLVIYASLFPIVDPIGNVPIFLGLTRRDSDTERYRLARVVAINSFFLLIGSLMVGSYILEFFGVTLPVVRIAGGLVGIPPLTAALFNGRGRCRS
jgi:hypothetical protein